MDYLLLVLGLASTLFGIMGDTWDRTKKGINKLTSFGKILSLISILAFGFASYSIYKKNKDIEDINNIAYNQIEKGITKLLSPVEFDTEHKHSSNFFERLKDTVYLAGLFKRNMLNIFNGVKIGGFDHQYQLDSANIQKGEDMLNDAVVKYNSFLDKTTITYINNVLSDKYYNNRYKLKEANYFIQIAISNLNDTTKSVKRMNSPYGSYRFYYSTKDKKGQHAYDGIISLIKKIELLNEHICSVK